MLRLCFECKHYPTPTNEHPCNKCLEYDHKPNWVAEADPVSPDHYQQGWIQPSDFIRANPYLTYCEGNVIKYLCRYRFKGGLEDLKKAKRYLDWVVEDAEKAAANS